MYLFKRNPRLDELFDVNTEFYSALRDTSLLVAKGNSHLELLINSIKNKTTDLISFNPTKIFLVKMLSITANISLKKIILCFLFKNSKSLTMLIHYLSS